MTTVGRVCADRVVARASEALPTVSVIVPTFNRSSVIGRALSSILNQRYQPTEIIVIDDCSSDDTGTVIESYQGHVPLIYVRLAKNSGGGVARNAGILRATGRYVAFLDSDDEWAEDHLLALIDVSSKMSGNFVVASSALRTGKKPRVLPGREYPEAGNIEARLHFVLAAPLAFQSSTLLMPVETAKRYLFDPLLRRHQDWDIVFRMIVDGVSMVLLQKATVKYHVPSDGDAPSVGMSRPLRPSLRFLIKHRAEMNLRSRRRFVALQIHRRQGSGLFVIASLLQAMILGGIGVKELIYYSLEAITSRR